MLRMDAQTQSLSSERIEQFITGKVSVDAQLRSIGSEKLNDLVFREVSMLDRQELTITPEMLENTQAMQQYYKEVQSFQNLLSMSARGLAYLSPNTGPNLQRAQEDAYREMIIRNTGLSRQEISNFVNELKAEEMKKSATRLTTKNALEILMKNLGVLIPRFYKDGTIINPSLRDDRIAQDPLKFLDWFIKYRPTSIYADSFRKVRGHIKAINEKAWRTPLDRDPIISRRFRSQLELMLEAKRNGLLGNKKFYVIYGLVQKKNLFTGTALAIPIFEIGYSSTPSRERKSIFASVDNYMNHIIGTHKYSASRALNAKGNVYFALALFRIFQQDGIIPSGARFGDYFEAFPIDMAATKKQRDNLEVFYTIYANRLNGPYSYGLRKNFLFNAIIGNKKGAGVGGRTLRLVVEDLSNVPVEPDEQRYYLFVTKEHLDSVLQLGLEKKDLKWYFRENEYIINFILDYYYPGKGFREIQYEVIGQYLTQLAEERVPYNELVNFFYKTDTDFYQVRANFKDPSFTPTLIPYSERMVRTLIKNSLGKLSDYNRILLDKLKRELLYMYSDGFITKEILLEEIRGASQFSLISPELVDSNTPAGEGFRYIFQLVYGLDIMRLLSSKDYGTVNTDLLKDLGSGFYIEADKNFNESMKSRLRIIISRMFHTTDLSSIYMTLNSRAL